MSIEENKSIARRWVEAFENPDAHALDQLADPNIVDRLAPPGLPPTLEGIKMQHGMYHGAFPGIRFQVENIIANENMSCVTWTAQGQNTGSLLGAPPTGKSATVHGTNVFRIANGKVVEHWVYFDRLAMLEQLGMVPAPSTS